MDPGELNREELLESGDTRRAEDRSGIESGEPNREAEFDSREEAMREVRFFIHLI